MNKLFIYYSNTGNGDLVAVKMADQGYDVIKVTPKKDLPKAFFFKVMTGGFLAGMGKKSKLVDFSVDLDKYEKVVIGSPIWNGRLSSPINTVLDQLELNGKFVSFIFYSGSGEAKKVDKQITKLGLDPKYIVLKEPKSNNSELEKLVDVIQEG